MAETRVALRPIHYASVSGGKDSLYMLKVIFENPKKYPLDMVVHFELEIDWDWSKRVVDEMERMCNEFGIKFVRLRPRKSWLELYEKYGYPNSRARWCNNLYKLDCKKQLNEWIKSQNCRPVAYIGFCADETARFKYEIGDWEKQDVCYPLAEEGIMENFVQEWASNQPLLAEYYSIFKRQGCKGCPIGSIKEWAYLYLREPESFNYYMNLLRKTEEMLAKKGKSYKFKNIGVNEFEKRVIYKWVPRIEELLNQASIF